MSKKPPNDRGAALITVLTMVSIMSALAIVAVDAASTSIRRTANQTGMEQTRWYLMGAEAFAKAKLGELAERAQTTRIDQSEWQGRAFSFPLDDGLMQVTLRDGGNCFNLNNLVQQDESESGAANAGAIMQFARLLDLIGVRSDRVALGASLADWIDRDTLPSPGGLEDGFYANGTPYMPANTLLADFGELRRVQGFSEDVIAQIASYTCVRPTSAPNLLNPNTLLPEQAPLLATILPDISVDDARAIIRDRPRVGWGDLDAFFSHPRLVGLEMNEYRRASFSMETSYYVMQARVEREEARESEAALIHVQGETGAVVRRLFGAGDAERAL
ncbi:MAG TPA: type II secretion system minor pseudopilin GspK [Verrucomicrobiae bacterium]|nr:type II secretion system minor pseudopilin GspK [Verrucomicrobiae bacterium]